MANEIDYDRLNDPSTPESYITEVTGLAHIPHMVNWVKLEGQERGIDVAGRSFKWEPVYIGDHLMEGPTFTFQDGEGSTYACRADILSLVAHSI